MKEETRCPNRIVWFDILNILSCFAVIAIHHNDLVWYYETANIEWKFSLLMQDILRFAVPCFFMLSGATLIEYRKRYSTKVFLQKRLIRTAIPYIIWTLIFGIIRKGLYEITSFSDLINAFATSRFNIIYWFFISLFILYLFIPLLSLVASNKDLQKFYIWSILILGSIMPLCSKLFNFEMFGLIGNPLYMPMLYALIGFYISKNTIDKKYKIAIYLLGIICLVTQYWVTFYHTVQDGALYSFLLDYSYIHEVIPAIAVFILIKDLFQHNKFIETHSHLIKLISSCSFGIYLIHILFVMELWRNILGIPLQGVVYQILLVPVTYLCSLVVVLGLKKIPILKYIVP